jgi:hypothetical protein
MGCGFAQGAWPRDVLLGLGCGIISPGIKSDSGASRLIMLLCAVTITARLSSTSWLGS